MTETLLDRIAENRSGSAPVPTPARSARARRDDRTERPLRRPPTRGSGRTAGPTLRPLVACPPPVATRGTRSAARACVLPAPERVPMIVEEPSTWRLTDRGVAMVLVVGLMLMVAALTVVGLTAVKVTGESYQPTVSAGMPR